MLQNVDPIPKDLVPVLEEFLAVPDYQPIFLGFARHMGYEGDDMMRVKTSLFAVKDRKIMFNVKGMEDLFLEFRLIKQLSNTEPYRTLFKVNPTAISKLRELAKRILNGEEVTNSHIAEVFNSKTETQDELKETQQE